MAVINLETTNLKNHVIDDSNRSVQDIVSKLNFISKIKEGEILDVSRLTLMEQNWGTSTYRTIFARGESREKSLDFFQSVIDKAFNLSSRYLSSNDAFSREIGQLIFEAIQKSKTGLNNHIKTYKNDRMYTSKIETLISTLDTRSNDIQREFYK